MSEQKSTLIFVPLPVISHLLATIKLAKLLTDSDRRLSVTVLIISLPSDNKISSHTKNSPNSRINFVHLQRDEPKSELDPIKSPKYPIVQFVDSQKGAVRAAAAAIAAGPSKVAGIVVDILCSPMIDVAAELGVPSYVFFTCGAAILGLMFHLQELADGGGHSLADYGGSDAEISFSTYVNPVPAKVWPSSAFEGESGFLDLTRKLREASGVIVNTFVELEPHAVAALASDGGIPAIHPVGPLIQDEEEPADGDGRRRRSEILRWLDSQPDSSVVFLCFGTNGCFEKDQVREIAAALEGSGSRFLWSLRKPPAKGEGEGPTEYEDPGEVLPEGFLGRTEGVGRVIGWAPQMGVLSHRAVGGFVSHCGWNSILESVSRGVPLGTWPMFAEQQANAFQLVKELEIGVEIEMEYRRNAGMVVGSDKIEKGIRELMDPGNQIRVKVKGLMEMSRSALMEGGSSYNVVHRFIQNLIP